MSDRPDARAALPALEGAILVGGRAERMGRPKQLISYAGQPMLERVVAALRPHVSRLRVVGAGPLPPALDALPRLEDVPGVVGPLAGMLAALRAAPEHAWLIAACDLPLLTPDAIAWLCGRRADDVVAVVPRVDQRGVEPLLAIYEPAAGPMLEALVARGQRAPRRLATEPGVSCPLVPAQLASSWTNVNRPEDLARLPR